MLAKLPFYTLFGMLAKLPFYTAVRDVSEAHPELEIMLDFQIQHINTKRPLLGTAAVREVSEAHPELEIMLDFHIQHINAKRRYLERPLFGRLAKRIPNLR